MKVYRVGPEQEEKIIDQDPSLSVGHANAKSHSNTSDICTNGRNNEQEEESTAIKMRDEPSLDIFSKNIQ